MTQSKIYVGNLSYDTTEDQLREHFSQYGNIEDIKLIIDFSTGRSKGFGFITYGSDQDCEIAVEKSNGFDMAGRKLKVNIARDDGRRTEGAARRPAGNNRPSYRDRDDRG
ncbi:MAG: RNA-binding protein [Gammaproteobacteria bacterium]|nr:RNA-binding protein [Gammaproteobacteria bacterium]